MFLWYALYSSVSGTRQYTIGQFIKGSTYGAGFVSPDKNDLYLTAIGGQEYDSYLTITKLSDNGNSLQGEEVIKMPTDFMTQTIKSAHYGISSRTPL